MFYLLLLYILDQNCSSVFSNLEGYSNNGLCVLEIMAPPVVTQNILYSLCDIIPGLESCNYESNRGKQAHININF